MSLEFAIERTKDQVRRAAFQFAARRAFRVTEPWYLDGFRVESAAGPLDRNNDQPPDMLSGMLDAATTFFLDKPKYRAYVDVELSRKRGQTIVSVKFGEHPHSAAIGTALQAFLCDESVFVTKTPVICPGCTTPVVNIRANFCGRCGKPLYGGPPLPITAGFSEPTAGRLPPLPTAPHASARDSDPAKAHEHDLAAGVTIEREEISTRLAAENEPSPEEAVAASATDPVANSEKAGAVVPDSSTESAAPRKEARRAGPMVVED